MNDATDVSLETDRLEQLLEGPVPAPPVVMIQYRARGIPWWVFVPLLFVVPIVTIVVYHHSVVERYRAQAAEATHFVETWAETAGNSRQPLTNPTTASPPVSPPPAVAGVGPQPAVAVPNGAATLPPAAATTAQTVLAPDNRARTSPAIETLKAATGTDPGTTSPGTGTTTAGAGTTEGAAQSEPPVALAAGGSPTPGASQAAGKSEVSPKSDSDGSVRTDPPTGPSGAPVAAGDQPPRPRVRSVFPSPFEEPEDHPAATKGAALEPVSPRRAPSPVVPEPEPLPSKEELERQIAEEAQRKELDMADEKAGRVAGIRAMRYDDRVKFHKELRELLELHGRDAGKEIDKMARRYSHDYNQVTYGRARSVWRHGRMTQRDKVNAIRALDIPEPAILDFMSDNLYARIRAPGGPRNENEVRIRAAQMLLSCELSAAPVATNGAEAAPDAALHPARPGTPRQTRPRPQ